MSGEPFGAVVTAGELFFDGVRRDEDVPIGFLGVFGAEEVVFEDFSNACSRYVYIFLYTRGGHGGLPRGEGSLRDFLNLHKRC